MIRPSQGRGILESWLPAPWRGGLSPDHPAQEAAVGGNRFELVRAHGVGRWSSCVCAVKIPQMMETRREESSLGWRRTKLPGSSNDRNNSWLSYQPPAAQEIGLAWPLDAVRTPWFTLSFTRTPFRTYGLGPQGIRQCGPVSARLAIKGEADNLAMAVGQLGERRADPGLRGGVLAGPIHPVAGGYTVWVARAWGCSVHTRKPLRT